MNAFLLVLHILVCVILILVVLLQRGKGSDMGAALGGGGSNTVFGSRGAGNFLTRLTTAAAIGFMLTSLSLSYLTNRDANVLVFDEEELQELAPTPSDDASADELQEIDVETSGETGASANELVEIEVEPTGEAAGEEK
jgi:preprotein translocase subunit SecG